MKKTISFTVIITLALLLLVSLSFIRVPLTFNHDEDDIYSIVLMFGDTGVQRVISEEDAHTVYSLTRRINKLIGDSYSKCQGWSYRYIIRWKDSSWTSLTLKADGISIDEKYVHVDSDIVKELETVANRNRECKER